MLRLGMKLGWPETGTTASWRGMRSSSGDGVAPSPSRPAPTMPPNTRRSKAACAQHHRPGQRHTEACAGDAAGDDVPDINETADGRHDPQRQAQRALHWRRCCKPRNTRKALLTAKAQVIKDALRAPQLAQPAAITAAYAAAVQASAAVLITLNEQIRRLEAQVEAHFLQHPDAEIYLSQPGIGEINGAWVLAEFGDAPNRYDRAKARKNYAGSSPITRASGRGKAVLARFIRNDRLADALQSQAFSALTTPPAPAAYYDRQRARGLGHNPALRQLSNRLAGILHGCLKTRTRYDEATAWPNAVTHPDCVAA